jgi:hypothetical protein
MYINRCASAFGLPHSLHCRRYQVADCLMCLLGLHRSYGGPITDVLAIYDTVRLPVFTSTSAASLHPCVPITDSVCPSCMPQMQYVSPPVHTVCIGQASSTGSLLLAAGEKGHRTILPNALVMLSQVHLGRAFAPTRDPSADP